MTAAGLCPCGTCDPALCLAGLFRVSHSCQAQTQAGVGCEGTEAGLRPAWQGWLGTELVAEMTDPPQMTALVSGADKQLHSFQG